MPGMGHLGLAHLRLHFGQAAALRRLVDGHPGQLGVSIGELHLTGLEALLLLAELRRSRVLLLLKVLQALLRLPVALCGSRSLRRVMGCPGVGGLLPALAIGGFNPAPGLINEELAWAHPEISPRRSLAKHLLAS